MATERAAAEREIETLIRKEVGARKKSRVIQGVQKKHVQKVIKSRAAEAAIGP